MYDFLQSRSRPGGVAKRTIGIPAIVWLIIFCLPRRAWGSEFLQVMTPLRLGASWGPIWSNVMRVRVCVFSRPPLRKCTLFFFCYSNVGMGTIIFHQNRKKSFGVTNSNMKTLARSIFWLFFKTKSHFILQNKRFGGFQSLASVVCHETPVSVTFGERQFWKIKKWHA